MPDVVHPPETIEGWYALHQIFTIARAGLRRLSADDRESLRASALAALCELRCGPQGSWSAVAPLIGSRADVMLVHFRPSVDELHAVQRRLAREPFFDHLRLDYSFLSVTEVGLYHATAQLAREAAARGGAVGDDTYQSALAERVRAERDSAHMQRRLYPSLPTDMPYVCFYPMSKRRDSGQNWYALTLDERSRLMHSHGLTGRRYAGRVLQVITGALGLDAWEWGVTLFAREPLEYKRLVTDMRFDEASAHYAEFGEFYVGRVEEPGEWVGSLEM
jgi:peroxiredoxin